MSKCKECRLQQNEKYRATGKHAENNKRYRQNNKEELITRQRLFRKNNPEKCIQYSATWRAKNPEKVRAIVRRRRERNRNIDSNFTHELELLVYKKFNNKCFSCNSEKRLEIDHHYPSIRGHGLSEKNAVLLCKSCNCSKGAKNPKDFYTKSQLKSLYKLGIS